MVFNLPQTVSRFDAVRGAEGLCSDAQKPKATCTAKVKETFNQSSSRSTFMKGTRSTFNALLQITKQQNGKELWRRRKLDFIAEKLGIKTQEDWYSIKTTQVVKLGGDILKQYQNSLYMALHTNYNEFTWNPLYFNKVPHHYWSVKQNQREYMDLMAEKLGIQTQEQWYSVTLKDATDFGASVMINNYYKSSLFLALKSIYEEFDWNPLYLSQVPRGHWLEHENQRILMDWIGEQCNVQKQEDWYSVSLKDIEKFGGKGFIVSNYRASILFAFQSIYPEFQWNPLFFHNKWSLLFKSKYSKRTVEAIAKYYDIATQDDWYTFIKREIYGSGKSRSMLKLLKKVYPELKWKERLRHGDRPKLLLAKPWNETIDPTGYWMSEKFDGSRAIWNGSHFVSRLGEVWSVPEWYTKNFPKDLILDGELWCGRNSFEFVQSLLQKKAPTDAEWKSAVFKVFDVPSMSNHTFEERMKFLEEYFATHEVKFAEIVKQEKCTGISHLKEKLNEIENDGGEGIMLRVPGSIYEPRRSNTLLKVKSFEDAEAIVVGHNFSREDPAKLSGLVCQKSNGTVFVIGSGFSDLVRTNPPPLGSVITYKYMKSNSDIPKFASFKGIRFVK